MDWPPLQVDSNEVQVELFASKEQHMMQLYCSKYVKNAYRFYWKSMGLCYANPPFSQLAKVPTKIALERARVFLCTAERGTTGEHTYWRRPLDRMTVGRTELPMVQSTSLRTLKRPCPPLNRAVSCPLSIAL